MEEISSTQAMEEIPTQAIRAVLDPSFSSRTLRRREVDDIFVNVMNTVPLISSPDKEGLSFGAVGYECDSSVRQV